MCPVCGGQLPLSSRRPRKFCSTACLRRSYQLNGKKAVYAARYRAANPNSWAYEAWRTFATRQCDRCGADLTKAERTVCSDCARIRRREREAAKEGWLKEIERDPYTLEEIAARDRYRCQICVALGRGRQARVNMKLKVPHLKAATIDHILARSNGGNDKRENVQLAHFGCNAWKQAGRLDQQLAMFG